MSDFQLVPASPRSPVERLIAERGDGWVLIELPDDALVELDRGELRTLAAFFDAAWAWAQAAGYHRYTESRDPVRCVTSWMFLRRAERPF